MDKKEQRTYDEMVSGIMASLDANYKALKRHPFTRGTRTDDDAAKEVADLLNRSVPVTNSEKIVAATFRWIAHKHRGAFIKHMFEGRFAYVCQYVDERLIEKGLSSEGTFSVNTTSDSFRIGEPRSSRNTTSDSFHISEPRSKRNRGRKHNKASGRCRDGRHDDYCSNDGSRGGRGGCSRGGGDGRGGCSCGGGDGRSRGGRDGCSRGGGDGGRDTPKPRSSPVLDESVLHELLDQLDRQVAEGAFAAVPNLPGDKSSVSYLAAASSVRKASPEPAAQMESKKEASPAAAPKDGAKPTTMAESVSASAMLTMPYPPGTCWGDVPDDDEEAKK